MSIYGMADKFLGQGLDIVVVTVIEKEGHAPLSLLQ